MLLETRLESNTKYVPKRFIYEMKKGFLKKSYSIICDSYSETISFTILTNCSSSPKIEFKWIYEIV